MKKLNNYQAQSLPRHPGSRSGGLRLRFNALTLRGFYA